MIGNTSDEHDNSLQDSDNALISDALARSEEAEVRGDAVEALHILRSVRLESATPKLLDSPVDGIVRFGIPVLRLVRQAREAFLSLKLGQWKDSPRHDPSSDSPHGFLTRYESMNPDLPENASLLRYSMDRLRVQVASDHERFEIMAAWSLDLYKVCRDGEPGIINPRMANEGLINMAVAMSQLGFKATAKNLYTKAMDDAVGVGNRAASAIRLGSYLWNTGERKAAEELYSSAIASYDTLESPTLYDLHNLVRALQRRADCYMNSSRASQAAADIDRAFRVIDHARSLGAYQSARSVDADIVEDLALLVHKLTVVESKEARPIALALCRVGNSSAASSIRQAEPRLGAPEEVYYTGRSSSDTARVRLAMRWHEFTDAEVDSLLSSEFPVLMTGMSASGPEQMTGVTVLAGAGAPPTVQNWLLDASDSALIFAAVRSLMSAPPGTKVTGDSMWNLPWRPEFFEELAGVLFPLDDLTQRLTHTGCQSIRVVPVGGMWRFPYATVPLGSTPLGAVCPYVLAPGPALNLPAPDVQRWAGHYDLSLSSAIAELAETLRTAKRLSLPFHLFNDIEELATVGDEGISHLIFSGHGQIGLDEQRLLLAGGRPCGAAELRGLALGATVMLNACWSGYVLDQFGSDPAELALEFVAAGAHSVLGTIGPVSDRSAGHFMGECLPSLAAGESLARSVRSAIANLLAAEADLPLASWASHVTVGRDTDFTTENETTSDS